MLGQLLKKCEIELDLEEEAKWSLYYFLSRGVLGFLLGGIFSSCV